MVAVARTLAFTLAAMLLLLPARMVRAGDSTYVLEPHFTSGAQVVYGFPQRTLHRPRIGLVLSGGGARGVAQIGVFRALQRHGVPVDFIAATSMGAIVGGLYAAGYTPTELESLAVTTDWDEVLSLTEETRRTEMFVDQKQVDDRSFVVVRFQGLTPVLPSAFSSGQRLTDFLSDEILQALYHPFPDFDHLKIPFRAVATDLISGKRVVLRDGSLAEALRASSTVPMLFNPVERDSMRLVDGGLVANVPVDVARSGGCDIALAVNTTRGLRTMDEMKAPWQTADQIMGIMMERVNERALATADFVITPDIGRHSGSLFRGLDTLIRQGEAAAELHMPEILQLVREKAENMAPAADRVRFPGTVSWTYDAASLPDSLVRMCATVDSARRGTVAGVRMLLDALYATGGFQDVQAAVSQGDAGTVVAFSGTLNPVLRQIRFSGCSCVPESVFAPIIAPLLGRTMYRGEVEHATEEVLRIYRKRGFSLARIITARYQSADGTLTFVLDEGVISAIDVQGGERTQDAFILREVTLAAGEVFEIDKARRGISNLSGTKLFEYVYLEPASVDKRLRLTIRIKERPSQLVRVGLRVDDERQLQGMMDIRDENFHGTGMDLGLTVGGGQRNSDITLEYKARRLFDSYLTFNVSAFHRVYDSYVYETPPQSQANRWQRDRIGEYRDIRYGFDLSIGSFLERLGNATADLLWQNIRLVNLDNLTMDERYRLVFIRLGTVVDTKDSYPFPTRGVGLKLSYEFSMLGLGSEIGYNSLYIMYESYASWGDRLTFHPKFSMGFADRTMPLAQQFRMGGRESFFGLREDDRRGRQLVLVNAELRYFLPVRLLFDTYVRARYDLGTISAVPEEIKFSSLLHGVGLELAFTTPIGPAVIGAGKSFYFNTARPDMPVQQGPFLVYFMIGYQL